MPKLALYGLYDTNEKERCIGIFTIYELMDYTNLERGSIYIMASRQNLFKNRYKIVVFDETEMMKND
ncbi:hypothetical protein [Candidatus Stoquefichus sp. SB1]|uniref:hypothetical protein n=1 Tax=Candidatus Stoquefichus sp. SB1 TaxID=1658109 RepID=UPI00067F5271|nr:hypothetical protein [Candidatus Stoquefichus sp. SB1]